MADHNDTENFLSRWSRRKQEAANPKSALAETKAVDDATSSRTTKATQDQAAAPAQGATAPGNPDAAHAFDYSKLPSLDSIGPTTDIRPFLQPGVPASLSRAALRRMWAADPAIRDYIGPSENAWDFTAPNEMHGFGPLLPTDDVKRLLAQVFRDELNDPDALPPAESRTPDETGSDVRTVSTSETDYQAQNSTKNEIHKAQSQIRSEFAQAQYESQQQFQNVTHENLMLHRNESDVASHQGELGPSPTGVVPRRRHGRALPT